jgi:hypothetical protein
MVCSYGGKEKKHHGCVRIVGNQMSSWKLEYQESTGKVAGLQVEKLQNKAYGLTIMTCGRGCVAVLQCREMWKNIFLLRTIGQTDCTEILMVRHTDMYIGLCKKSV